MLIGRTTLIESNRITLNVPAFELDDISWAFLSNDVDQMPMISEDCYCSVSGKDVLLD